MAAVAVAHTVAEEATVAVAVHTVAEAGVDLEEEEWVVAVALPIPD